MPEYSARISVAPEDFEKIQNNKIIQVSNFGLQTFDTFGNHYRRF